MTDDITPRIWFNNGVIQEHMFVSKRPFVGGIEYVPADALTAAQARIAELEAERDALSEYAKEATVTITNLTAGGSEFFAGTLPSGMYKADLKRCAEYIRDARQRDYQRVLTSYERGRLQGLDEAAKVAHSHIPGMAHDGPEDAIHEAVYMAAGNIYTTIQALKTKGQEQ